jgi:acetyltransferase-like isoleucine patch superfamily enzyme
MSLIHALRKCRLGFSHFVQNLLKRAQLTPFGFHAESSTVIAWTVSADGGGQGGQIVVGHDTRLDIGVVLRAYGGFISIGDHCSVNPYCVLYGKGGLKIGNGVRIASHSVIVAANHRFEDAHELIYRQGEYAVGIIIEDDVWIGAGAKILDGVTIRTGTVVGAGAVVTRSTEAWSVVAGAPARKIGSRLTEASQKMLASG